MMETGEVLRKLGELWPEVLGGFVAYCAHTLSHGLYRRAWHVLGRALTLGRRRP